jgi:hypothetical protein
MHSIPTGGAPRRSPGLDGGDDQLIAVEEGGSDGDGEDEGDGGGVSDLSPVVNRKRRSGGGRRGGRIEFPVTLPDPFPDGDITMVCTNIPVPDDGSLGDGSNVQIRLFAPRGSGVSVAGSRSGADVTIIDNEG